MFPLISILIILECYGRKVSQEIQNYTLQMSDIIAGGWDYLLLHTQIVFSNLLEWYWMTECVNERPRCSGSIGTTQMEDSIIRRVALQEWNTVSISVIKQGKMHQWSLRSLETDKEQLFYKHEHLLQFMVEDSCFAWCCVCCVVGVV